MAEDNTAKRKRNRVRRRVRNQTDDKHIEGV